MSPRPSPVIDHDTCNELYMGSIGWRAKFYIIWKAYVFVRPGSLSVEGQEPADVHVCMYND